MTPNARETIAQQAANLLQSGFVLIDFETTGLPNNPSVEIVEIAILDHTGATVMDTLVKPENPIPRDASAIHGITDQDVADQPTFPELYDQLEVIFEDRVVVAYNHTFEADILVRVCDRHDLEYIDPQEWWCAMRAYQRYIGARRYVKLTLAAQQQNITVVNAHRAKGDCIMTLELMKKMAQPTQQTLF